MILKDKYINFRASEREKKQLAIMAKKAKMYQSDFIRHAIFNKEIVVIDGLKDVLKELKRIGNNLNQITTRSNMGHFQTVFLTETKAEFAKINDSISLLCERKNDLIEADSFDDEEEVINNDFEINSADKAEYLENSVPVEPTTPSTFDDPFEKFQQAMQANHEKHRAIEEYEKPHNPSFANTTSKPKASSVFSDFFDRNRGD